MQRILNRRIFSRDEYWNHKKRLKVNCELSNVFTEENIKIALNGNDVKNNLNQLLAKEHIHMDHEPSENIIYKNEDIKYSSKIKQCKSDKLSWCHIRKHEWT